MSGMLSVPIASLPLLARGPTPAAQRRLALDSDSAAITLSLTTDSPVTHHQYCRTGSRIAQFRALYRAHVNLDALWTAR